MTLDESAIHAIRTQERELIVARDIMDHCFAIIESLMRYAPLDIADGMKPGIARCKQNMQLLGRIKRD